MIIHDILHEIRLKAITEREKGGDFERLMKLWFLTDPRYSNLEKVWLWEEFPCRKDFGGKDLGIDLVARTEYGDYWAIQCKCYAEDAVIDKAAVDSFLANASQAFVDPDTFQTPGTHLLNTFSSFNHQRQKPLFSYCYIKYPY